VKILITGGAGFIGSNVAEHFHQSATVRVFDNLRTGNRQNLAGLDVEFICGSILDRRILSEAMEGIDYVFHLAAMVSVPESLQQPRECVELNVTGFLNVLEAAEAAGVRKLCFSSSAAVYGDNPKVPKREDMLPEPRSPYAITKLDGEFYCRQFSDSGRLETVALRFFNVFGPRQDPNGTYGAAVPRFFKHALLGEPLSIFGDGGQTRDFVYVADAVAALSFAINTPGLIGVFNVGYGEQLTVLELARQIITLTDSPSKIQFEPGRVGDVRHSRACVERMRNIGFQPRGTLSSGLKHMHRSFLSSKMHRSVALN
jgi:UDP-glucose 4-epimerase